MSNKLLLPSQEELLRLLRYEPETGKLFWRVRPMSMFPDERAWKSWNTKHSGHEALTANTSGYKTGAINRINYRAHRIIWMLVFGKTPVQIDHINGNRSDNRLKNLRSVSEGENRKNHCRRADNSSGVTGVRWRGGWLAYIVAKRKFHYLGKFDDLADAAAARKRAEIEHGFHPNHGRVMAA